MLNVKLSHSIHQQVPSQPSLNKEVPSLSMLKKGHCTRILMTWFFYLWGQMSDMKQIDGHRVILALRILVWGAWRAGVICVIKLQWLTES